jgi:hypothetical protein
MPQDGCSWFELFSAVTKSKTARFAFVKVYVAPFPDRGNRCNHQRQEKQNKPFSLATSFPLQ